MSEVSHTKRRRSARARAKAAKSTKASATKPAKVTKATKPAKVAKATKAATPPRIAKPAKASQRSAPRKKAAAEAKQPSVAGRLRTQTQPLGTQTQPLRTQTQRLGTQRQKLRAKTQTKAHTQTRAVVTVGELIQRGAKRLDKAGVFFGHGTDNAIDDAAALVWHALKLPDDFTPRIYDKKVTRAEQESAEALIERRIFQRIPAVYLTGQTWFAGMPFNVDPRVLIPRSAIAELIEQRFAPWVNASKVKDILDIGTGSGCIAIACAAAFPKARVDGSDISPEALEVAATNVRRHRLDKRVRLVISNHFSALDGKTYDIIVSNPPYVGSVEMRSLPPEYGHEPRLALAAGRSGLDSVRVILSEAGRHLNPRGVLVVEVGNTEAAVRRAYPKLPFTWLEFERGGGGVFLLTAEQLAEANAPSDAGASPEAPARA